MTEEAWNQGKSDTIGMILSGDAMDEFNQEGIRIADETLLVLLNASEASDIQFRVPGLGEKWELFTSHLFQKIEPQEKILKKSEFSTSRGNRSS